MDTNNLTIHWEPLAAVPGLRFRHFSGDADYRARLEIAVATKEVNGVDWNITYEDIVNDDKWTPNFDIHEQLIYVELDGKIIGYFGYTWDTELDGKILFLPWGVLLPEYWGRGIANLMLRYTEEKCCEIAASMPAESEKRYRVWKKKKAVAFVNFLQENGYKIERFFNCMIRPIELPLVEHPLPPGMEIRPVEPAHYRAIWDATWEAFKDHWGYTPPTEEMYQVHLTDRFFQPHLWKVAWEGDRVCGVVHNFLDEEENEMYNRKRGYTEDISVGREWRGKGVAKALITESIRMFREMDMDHTWLTVDSENLSGAHRLYELLGYTVVEDQTSYNLGKPL